MTNALHRLHDEQGQSPWIDFIDRDLLTSGRLAQLVDDGIRGLTSNPTIFAKAVATGQYDELIRREIAAGDDARQIYEAIAVSDVGDAADVRTLTGSLGATALVARLDAAVAAALKDWTF